MNAYEEMRLKELEMERDPTAKAHDDHIIRRHEDGTTVELYKTTEGHDIWRIVNGGFIAMTMDKDNVPMYTHNIQHMAAEWAILTMAKENDK